MTTEPGPRRWTIPAGRRPIRVVPAVVGVALAALAASIVIGEDTGVWQAGLFALAPDLPRLLGRSDERGRIRSWAVRPHNATHRFVGPILVAVAALGLPPGWIVGALAWAAHVALGRARGGGMRGPDGRVRPTPARSGRLARGLAVLVLALVAVGGTYEALASRTDADRYPPPGELVMVGGRRFHLDCDGSGSPTVVMEAGLGEPSLTWTLVQPEIAADTRVCVYDRAGYGWSEPGPTPRTADREVAELLQLLRTAGEEAPFVIVAHSIGAIIARTLVASRPEDVAGVVLVDPTDERAVVEAGRPVAPIAQYRVSSTLARLGVVRLLGGRLVPWMVGTDPPGQVVTAAAVVYGATALDTAVEELESSVAGARSVLDAANGPGAWGTLPLVVITAGEGGDPRHGELVAALSEVGRHVVAGGSGHYVQYTRPDVVVEAVREMLRRIRVASGS